MKTTFAHKQSNSIANLSFCQEFGDFTTELKGIHGYIVNRINVGGINGKIFRGQGIGTKLLEEICEEADKEQENLILWIHDSENHGYEAISFWYQRYGFVPYPMKEGGEVFVRRPKK